jgi:hypothetical protein
MPWKNCFARRRGAITLIKKTIENKKSKQIASLIQKCLQAPRQDKTA